MIVKKNNEAKLLMWSLYSAFAKNWAKETLSISYTMPFFSSIIAYLLSKSNRKDPKISYYRLFFRKYAYTYDTSTFMKKNLRKTKTKNKNK